MKTNEQPDWLKRIISGIADGHKVKLLIDGKRYAVVQNPGGYWSDNGGRHYGSTSYYLVDKNGRSGDGLVRNGKIIKESGRVTKALLVEWAILVAKADETPVYAQGGNPNFSINPRVDDWDD